MVKAREESLKKTSFPRDEEIEEQETVVIPDDLPGETFSTGNVNMGGQGEDENREELQDAVIDVE